jgi:hypothetical protein
MTDFTSQIDAWYQAIQFRVPPAAELASFNAQLQAGVLTTDQAINQIEISTYTMTYVNPVIRMYQAGLGRVPDQGGESYWVNAFANGTATLSQMSTIFANSAEFMNTYGANATTPASPTLITALYQNILNRAPDQAGLTYWSSQNLDAAQLLQVFATSPEFIADTAAPIIVYQNLEVLGTEPTSGTLFQPILNPVFPQTFTLTTGVDTIVSTQADIINGISGGFQQTLTNGDNIQGNANTTMNIVISNPTFTPGLATVTGVGQVNITATASNTINAALWSGVGEIALTSSTVNGVQGTNTGIANAPISTTYAINTPGIAANLYVGFGQTGAGKFSLDSGTSAKVMATLDATGTTAFANGIANALTSASIATAGTNFDIINLGTNAALVTMTGTGVDTFTFGALAKNVKIDFHTMPGNQTLTFADGAFNDNNTILGGTGTNQITANDLTGPGGPGTVDSLTMSGVQTFITTFDGILDGTHITGLHTVVANQFGPTGGPVTLQNMAGDFTTLDVNGLTGLTSVGYAGATPATALTVTYGPGSSTANDFTIFSGLTVSNVAALTVDFNNGADFTEGTVGIQLDPAATTDLTLNNIGGNKAEVFIVTPSGDAALQNLTVEASGAKGQLILDNGPNIDTVDIYHDVNSINVIASATSSDAEIVNPNTDGAVEIYGHITTLNVLASGDASIAAIRAMGFQGKGGWTGVYDTGGIGTLNVTASGNSVTPGGDGAKAFIYGGGTGVYSTGAITNLNVTASGTNSEAYIRGGYNAVYIVDGASNVNVTASGTGSNAQLEGIDGYGFYSEGNVGNFKLTASGAASQAHIDGLNYNDGVYVTGDIGTMVLLANGIDGRANIYGGSTGVIVGSNMDTLTLTASAQQSDASIYGGYDTGVYVEGDLGNVTLTASGEKSDAHIDGSYYGIYVDGNVNSISITASGDGSTAYIGNGYGYNYIGGDLGKVVVDASGAGSTAWLYDTEVGGNVGPVTITASGPGSFAEAEFSQYSSTTQKVGDVALTASGGGFAEFWYEGIGKLSNINVSAAANSTADVALHLHDGSTLGTGQQSGVITASGAGTVDVNLYGHSITSFDGTGMTATSTLNFIVDNPLQAVEGMNITGGFGNNHIQVGDGEGTYGSNAPGSNVNTINLNGTHNEVDFSNLQSVFTSGATNANLGTGVFTQTDVVTGFVSHNTSAASQDTIAFDTVTNGTTTNFVGGVGGVLNLSVGALAGLVDIAFALDTNLQFAAGSVTTGGHTDTFVFYNGGIAGGPALEIIDLVGVSAVTASDIHHA